MVEGAGVVILATSNTTTEGGDYDKHDEFPSWEVACSVGASEGSGSVAVAKVEPEGSNPKVASREAREFVKLVRIATLKKHLRDDPRVVIRYEELLQLCRTVGMASSDEEAAQMAHVFHEAGVVLRFGEIVHLDPEQIAGRVTSVLPVSLLGKDVEQRNELMALTEKKQTLDLKALRQTRLVLFIGFLGLMILVKSAFRLTFVELSWDVMGPVVYFVAAGAFLWHQAYFMITLRKPGVEEYQKRIYQCRQRKIYRRENFDI